MGRKSYLVQGLRNRKGNSSFAIISYAILIVVMMSCLVLSTQTITAASRMSKGILDSYKLGILENIAVSEFVNQLSEYVTSEVKTDETTTEVYFDMIKSVSDAMVDSEGNLIYVSPTAVLHQLSTDDEITLIELFELADDPLYTEQSGLVAGLSPDTFSEYTEMNFQDGDSVTLEPIQLFIKFECGSLGQVSLFEVYNVVMEFSHDESSTIFMRINTENVKVKRMMHSEYIVEE